MTASRQERSKAAATWLALVGGCLGLHRFYLHGLRDPLGWLHLPPTLVGAYGFWRMREFGTDDRVGSLLVPLLGAMIVVAALAAIVFGLASNDRWAASYGRGIPGDAAVRFTIAGVIVALAVGATAAMATIAFTAQRYFESQVTAQAGHQTNSHSPTA